MNVFLLETVGLFYIEFEFDDVLIPIKCWLFFMIKSKYIPGMVWE